MYAIRSYYDCVELAISGVRIVESVSISTAPFHRYLGETTGAPILLVADAEIVSGLPWHIVSLV